MADEGKVDNDWRGDFDTVRQLQREASLLATPSQRLAWLEEALAFAAKMGALPRRDEDAPGSSR